MKKTLLNILIISTLIYVCFLYFFSDIQSNTYRNLTDIKNKNAIKRGWIPSILPLSAYKITETHNIDTNEIWGTFKYKERDEVSFLKQLTPKNSKLYQWKGFLFKVDKKLNLVQFENEL